MNHKPNRREIIFSILLCLRDLYFVIDKQVNTDLEKSKNLLCILLVYLYVKSIHVKTLYIIYTLPNFVPWSVLCTMHTITTIYLPIRCTTNVTILELDEFTLRNLFRRGKTVFTVSWQSTEEVNIRLSFKSQSSKFDGFIGSRL